MSLKVMTLVWERSRAKGTCLLVLLGIADYAHDDGRFAWPSPGTLATKSRMTGRAAELLLAKLTADGEVEAEWSATDERLYLHIRCVCDWAAYQTEGLAPLSEKISRKTKRTFAQKLCRLTTAYANGPTRYAKKSAKSGDASITDPSGSVRDPSEDPGADGAPPSPPDTAEDLAALWNDRTALPILRCGGLTAKRRRLATARLAACPLLEWAVVFGRIQASAFCRGENARGWIASFEWAIGSPDVAIKVLEGQYDDRPGRERPFTTRELEDAQRLRTHVWGGCRHEARCANSQVCVGHIIRQWRRDRGEAA